MKIKILEGMRFEYARFLEDKFFFKHRYPMTVQEFQQLAGQCGYPETKSWHWLTEKRIAEALDKVGERDKFRLLKVKGRPKAEWEDIADIPRADGKGMLTSSQVQAIKHAVSDLVWQLEPHIAYSDPSGQSLDLDICCPECNAKFKLRIRMERGK